MGNNNIIYHIYLYLIMNLTTQEIFNKIKFKFYLHSVKSVITVNIGIFNRNKSQSIFNIII